MGMLLQGQWLADDEARRVSERGIFVRPQSAFREFVSADGSSEFPAEFGRYHLYVSFACPWAHRATIVRKVKGLEKCISMSIVAPWTSGEGWGFSAFPDATPDEINSAKYMHEIYTLADPTYSGRVTVPVLWDKIRHTIVNNESAEIIRMLNSEFNEYAEFPGADLYPKSLRAEIDRVNEAIYWDVNHGVYRAGFSTSQEEHEKAVTALFQAFDKLEVLLSSRRYLCGDVLTEADWRLFTTLIRFDCVYYLHFKCNLRRLADYRYLDHYVRELYQFPGVAETVNFDHIKRHYYTSHKRLNPSGLIPLGPELDFNIPDLGDQIQLSPQ